MYSGSGKTSALPPTLLPSPILSTSPSTGSGTQISENFDVDGNRQSTIILNKTNYATFIHFIIGVSFTLRRMESSRPSRMQDCVVPPHTHTP